VPAINWSHPMSTPVPKHELDNRSNQLNPCHPLFYLCRGIPESKAKARAQRLSSELRPPVSVPPVQPSCVSPVKAKPSIKPSSR